MQQKNDDTINDNNSIDFQDLDILYKIEKIKVNRPIIGIVNTEPPRIQTLELFLDNELINRITKLESQFEELKKAINNLEIIKEIGED